VALRTAQVLAGIALLATLVLAWTSRAPLQSAALLLLAMVLAWSYSSPPLRLNDHGWGELTGSLLVPGLTTLVGFQLQAGTIALLPVLAVVPLCCFQFAMLLSVNFPDAAGDALVGKRTLVVIFGGRRAARFYQAALLLGYASLPLLLWWGLPVLAAGAALLSLPIWIWLLWQVQRGIWDRPEAWDRLAFWSIGLLMSTAAFETAAFVVLGLR
jgi:1,4-dihydroxy-2-naphthoate octaprenyltransferase